jgi:hypothetical protein
MPCFPVFAALGSALTEPVVMPVCLPTLWRVSADAPLATAMHAAAVKQNMSFLDLILRILLVDY